MGVVLLCLLVLGPLVGYIIWAIHYAIDIKTQNEIVEEEKAKLEKRLGEIDDKLDRYNEKLFILFDELHPINIVMVLKLVNHEDLNEEAINNKRDELKNKIKIIEEKRDKLMKERDEINDYWHSLILDGYNAYKRKHNL